jgi:hypothetical protein
MMTEANDNDPRVSDVYRNLANETTPAELDRKVLAMAADEARASRGVPSTWFRPLAWAATVALSFALVLEITQVEENPQPAEATRKQKDEAGMKQQLNKRSSDAAAGRKATIVPAQPEAAARDAAANTPIPESLAVTPALEQDSLGLVREVEEEARARSEPGRTASAFAESKEWSDGCGEDARESAESWYECVEFLRDAGRTAAAQQELEALLVDFPDFREPSGDR